MRSAKLARRYAEALGELAFEQGALDQVEQELLTLRELLEGREALRRVLESRQVKPEEKQRLINEMFAGKLSRITLNFLLLVVAKHREAHLEGMIDEYVAYANKKRGVVQVEVTVAHPLSEEQAFALSEKLAQVLGKKVRLSAREDPEVLGGVIARVGDLVMDGSVATRLQRLQEALKRARLN